LKTYILVIIVVCALVCFLLSLAFLLLKDTKKDQKSKEKPTIAKVEVMDLEDLIRSANNEKLNDLELKELAKIYIRTQKLGGRKAKELSDKTKRQLDFITSLSANPNASAKTISFLNTELKKNSMSFAKEIDTYEQIGIAKRKMRS